MDDEPLEPLEREPSKREYFAHLSKPPVQKKLDKAKLKKKKKAAKKAKRKNRK